MKILILTQYFPPEIGAPQNRLFELAIRLKEKGNDITVLTAMPNYPQMKIHEKYSGKFRHYEEMDGLKVFRSWIFVSKSKSIFMRLLNYFSFTWTSFWSGLLRVGKPDIIICESPPLFLGISAYLLKKIKRAKLVFNVSDLWPESAEKLGLVTNNLFLGIAKSLEEFLYKHSELVTGQTQGIVKNISSRFPEKKTYWLPNGVDLNYYDSSAALSGWRKEKGFSDDDFILLYAGIIGHAQGLEIILRSAQLLSHNSKIKFILLGNGPEKDSLLSMKEKMNLSNIFFYDAVSKKEMPFIISASNASIIPLKRLDLFKGAIPSKIFESLAMQKAILLGVEGEAKDLFIEEGKCGLAFEPENEKALTEKILILYNDRKLLAELGANGRNYVNLKFNRNIIAENLQKVLISLFPSPSRTE
ncbi:MAG TPA: glycosyltransferase family 4 protein [Bacteroidia bacterium]